MKKSISLLFCISSIALAAAPIAQAQNVRPSRVIIIREGGANYRGRSYYDRRPDYRGRSYYDRRPDYRNDSYYYRRFAPYYDRGAIIRIEVDSDCDGCSRSRYYRGRGETYHNRDIIYPSRYRPDRRDWDNDDRSR